MKIYEAAQDQVNDSEMNDKFTLWWSDFEEAGIEGLWLAENEDGEIVGFLAANIDGLCIAIEVVDAAQGQGVARALVEASGCWKPEDNQCPEFWEKMAEEFGW